MIRPAILMSNLKAYLRESKKTPDSVLNEIFPWGKFSNSNIIAFEINETGYWYRTVPSNAYCLFLWSKIL